MSGQAEQQGLTTDLRDLLQRIQRAQAMGSTPAAAAVPYLGLALAALEGEDDVPLSVEARQGLGARIRQGRERLGLSQAAAAERSGLSERTVKNVESGVGSPSPETLRRLHWLVQIPDSRPPAPTELRANSWLAPRYDCAGLNEELQTAVNGTGGSIEQTLLYVDPHSALAWLEISRSAHLVEQFWDRCPIGSIAQHIGPLLTDGATAAEVIALGCGDGRNEIRLTSRLRDLAPRLPLRLCLLDISHLLLTEANSEAQRVLSPRGVDVMTLHANFLRLARYPELTGAGAARPRRVWTLFGYTLSNLEDEPQFFDTLAACAQPGDVLILDFQLTHAPADQPDLVQRRDPGLRPDAPVDEHVRWLTSAFRKHTKDLQSIDVSRHLDTAVSVPASYAINWQAKVRIGSHVRLFQLARSRRYDADRLAAWLTSRGWGGASVTAYGAGEQPRQAVLVLQRQ